MVMQFIKDPFGIKRRRQQEADRKRELADEQRLQSAPKAFYGRAATLEDVVIRSKLAEEHKKAFKSGAIQKGERFSQRPAVRDSGRRNDTPDTSNVLLNPGNPLSPLSPLYSSGSSHHHRADDCAPSTHSHSHTPSHSYTDSGSSCGSSDSGGSSDGGGGGGGGGGD